MKVQFNACLAILLSDVQWKQAVKNQAYTASKLRMCIGTKLEKSIWINLF